MKELKEGACTTCENLLMTEPHVFTIPFSYKSWEDEWRARIKWGLPVSVRNVTCIPQMTGCYLSNWPTTSSVELAIIYKHMFLLYSKVNPSDCVDMDCDGHKKMLIEDTDGSFLPGGQWSLYMICSQPWFVETYVAQNFQICFIAVQFTHYVQIIIINVIQSRNLQLTDIILMVNS